MGWDQDSQVMDGLTEHRAYNTAERHEYSGLFYTIVPARGYR